MKKEKISAALYYVASVLFYLAAIMSFANESGNSMKVAWLALGSVFLCLGTIYSRKSGADKDGKAD